MMAQLVVRCANLREQEAGGAEPSGATVCV